MGRRLAAVDLMLLGTVFLWALNLTTTRYLVTNGFLPLAYATLRYGAATVLFWGFTWPRERSFRVGLSDRKLVLLAALLIFLNQVCFVNAVHLTTASTVALMMGTIPIFIGVIASAIGLERPGRRFWLAASVSFLGVGLVAAGGGAVSGDLLGDLLAVCNAALWAGYSVTIAPLLRRYSPFRISALVLAFGWVPLALVSIPQLERQSLGGLSWLVWLTFAFAVVGPLFLTNILWFTAIDRVGPARAALFANLQPFVAVVLALILLSERLNRWEIAGGVAIGAAIAIERARRPVRRREQAIEPVPVE